MSTQSHEYELLTLIRQCPELKAVYQDVIEGFARQAFETALLKITRTVEDLIDSAERASKFCQIDNTRYERLSPKLHELTRRVLAETNLPQMQSGGYQ